MCSVKTMVKIALGIGLLLVMGYVIFPQYQAAIAAVAPFLLVLACPLAMYFMMAGKSAPPRERETKPGQDDR